MSALLRAVDLAYAYHGRAVLDGVSLQLQAGESVALLGANGSGKSTLLRLLLGFHRPAKGEVYLGGESLQLLPARERARRVAYVPQDHGTTFPFLVRDMVLMGRSPHRSFWGRATAHDLTIAEKCLERLGIADLADRPYLELSGGQRQLVLIARALAQEARVLILDEPITGLDYGNQLRLLEHIRELTGNGYAVLQSTHVPDHALAANRVILLHEGRILADGSARETLSPKHLQRIYGVRAELVEVKDGRQVVLPVIAKEIPMPHFLRIFASLTLQQPFQRILPHFQATYGDLEIKASYGFCGMLMEKMAAGAPVDVFAPSSEAMLAEAVRQGLARAEGAVNYARNQLILITPRVGVSPTCLEDLLDERFARIAIGAPESVPPGRYGRMALESLGLWASLESRLQQYPDGIQPLRAVLEGRADAAFVFASTASSAAAELQILEIPLEQSMHYPASVATRSTAPELASAFVTYLQSPNAQEILAQAGFLPPRSPIPVLESR